MSEEDAVMDWIDEARNNAVAWAKRLLARPDWMILDTETTGLGRGAQVVQVAMLAPDGTPVLDTLVKATVPVEPEAFRIHRLGEEELKDAPSFAEVLPRIVEASQGKYLVIYNGDFDLRMLRQSALAVGLDTPLLMHYDAMIEYARYYGEWNDYRHDFRWQKLPGGDHSAMGDCRAVLALIQRMAGVTE